MNKYTVSEILTSVGLNPSIIGKEKLIIGGINCSQDKVITFQDEVKKTKVITKDKVLEFTPNHKEDRSEAVKTVLKEKGLRSSERSKAIQKAKEEKTKK